MQFLHGPERTAAQYIGGSHERGPPPTCYNYGGRTTMALQIRRAEKRDMKSLGKLGAMLMRVHYEFDPLRFLPPGAGTESGYAQFLSAMLDSRDACVFVAEEAGVVIGYTFVALEPLSWKELRGPAGFVHDLAVAEESRRTGAGTRLMSAGTEWLREQGAPRVILWTAAPNAAAQALFHKLGFRDTMIEMTKEVPRE
jgi:ribosomal protein S18 acetylase RimI-like enzyme